jgi:tetratricopeptide (TPR) repeat protein
MLARRVRTLIPLGALMVVAGAAYAQSSQHSSECAGLRYSGNFRLNSAKLYLDLAVSKQRSDPARFQGALRDAQRQVDEAARAGGSDEMTLAFFFGEIAILRGDFVAADSMFTKAEATAGEECKREMNRLRRNEWAPYANGAVNQQRAGNVDSALALLRRGNIIWRAEPTGFLRMASIFSARNQTDSAITYARLACRASEEARFLELRKAACFTTAELLQTANRQAEAETAFREYLRIAPRDLPGMAGLGAALVAQHKTADANVLYDSLQAAADTVTDSDVLFETATGLVRAQRYSLAVRLYERELTLNRCDRDGLYNLASTYNSLHDTVRMLPTAQRLVAVDSMNRGSLAMLAQAQVLRRDTASIGTLQRLQALPWSFELVRFAPSDTAANVQAGISNNQDRALPAFRLTIEFLNGACEPVSQTVVEVPEVPANGSHAIDVTGRGRGIRAYRYRTN